MPTHTSTSLRFANAAKDGNAQGVVRISASVSLAHFVLPELLDVFRSQHSGIRFDITATDSVSNLSQREADIAIRLIQPKQQDLIAKRVTYLSTGLYATQRYLSRRGIPKLEVGSLMQHDYIDVAPQNPLRDGFAKAGFPQLADRIVCTTTDHANGWHLIRADLGIGSGLKIVAERDNQITKSCRMRLCRDFPYGW